VSFTIASMARPARGGYEYRAQSGFWDKDLIVKGDITCNEQSGLIWSEPFHWTIQ
jgi:hypothetical protein